MLVRNQIFLYRKAEDGCYLVKGERILRKIKILHTADLHLDNGFTASALPRDIIQERKKDLLEIFDKIIEVAKVEKVDLLFIAGDLFEQRLVKLQTIQYVNYQLSTLENTRVFILPGNHDPYHLVYYYKSFPWNFNITIFTPEYQKVHLKDIGVWIHGMGYGYQEEKRPLLETIQCEDTEEINILLLHGSDVTNSPSKQSKYLPFNEDDLYNSGFDYIALGHYHKFMIYKNAYGNPIAAYPGSPEPLGFDEKGMHGIILGEISKGHNIINVLPMAKRSYHQMEVNISDCAHIEEIKEKIIQKINPLSPEISLFHIVLKGDFTWEKGLNIEFLKKQFYQLCYYIQIEDQIDPSYDVDSLIHENTLVSAYILEIQRELREEKDEKRRKILKKALSMGIEALKGGGY